MLVSLSNQYNFISSFQVCDRPAANFTVPTNLVSCCHSCSCQADCGYHQNCCDKSQNEEATRTTGHKCVAAFSGDYGLYTIYRDAAYIMTTVCVGKDELCSNDADGNMFVQPVTGDDSVVYLNPDCARCNGVNTFVAWTIQVVMNEDIHSTPLWTVLKLDDGNALTKIFHPVENSILDPCTYTIQGNVDRCNKTVQELCSSVFLPFFTGGRYYNNAFCVSCEGLDIHPLCPDLGGAKSVPNSFSLLLDTTTDLSTIKQYTLRGALSDDTRECAEGYVPHLTRVRLFSV